VIEGTSLISRAQRGDTLRDEIGLKIREERGQSSRRLDKGELGLNSKNTGYLDKIIRVIGSKVNRSARTQDLGSEAGEPFIDEAMLLLFAFGPGIGEVDMERRDRMMRQEVFEEIDGFNSNQTDVGELAARRFPLDFAEASEEPLDPDEIAGWLRRCVMDEKRTVAAAEVDFDWLPDREEGFEWKGIEDGLDANDG
jgi:hypothetical protein